MLEWKQKMNECNLNVVWVCPLHGLNSRPNFSIEHLLEGENYSNSINCRCVLEDPAYVEIVLQSWDDCSTTCLQ